MNEPKEKWPYKAYKHFKKEKTIYIVLIVALILNLWTIAGVKNYENTINEYWTEQINIYCPNILNTTTPQPSNINYNWITQPLNQEDSK